MTELLEMAAVGLIASEKEVCSLCGQAHDQPKRDDVTETAPADKKKWGRVDMNGVFEQGDSVRNSIYRNGFKPGYRYQGHHCIALSALTQDANSRTRPPKDRRLRLNFYLKEIGFYPNRPRNCIGLPERKGLGSFGEFWKAVDEDHPLQMHGPGHDESYFARCEVLIAAMVRALEENCDGSSRQESLDMLKQLAECAENYAFKQLANCDDGWTLHPIEQSAAIRLYSATTSTVEVVSGAKRSVAVCGYGKPPKAIHFPRLSLDGGVFD